MHYRYLMTAAALAASALLQAPQKDEKKPVLRPINRKLPFEVLTAPMTAETARQKLGGNDTLIYLEGDVLTVLRKQSGEGVRITGGIQEAMKKVEGTDLWVLQLKMEGWEKAFFSYAFVGGDLAPGSRIKFQTWYGSQAPAKLQAAQTLKGKVIKTVFRSESLGEERGLAIYLPPNAPDRDIPAFFMADGQGCEEYAKALEPLILAGKVRPAAIVGIYSGDYKGDRTKEYDPKLDMRGVEYIPHEDLDRYAKHMDFFTREVPAYVAKEYHISTKREDRAVFGFSNGGAFSAAAAIKHPEVFAHTMPLSLGVPPEDPKPESPLPVFHFAAGELETFKYGTRTTYEKVKGWGADATLDLFVSGHDPEMWRMAFVKYAPMVFPAK